MKLFAQNFDAGGPNHPVHIQGDHSIVSTLGIL